MFERISRLAEGLASNFSTSRRGFLGRVGKSAMGVAGAMGAALLLQGTTQAAPYKAKRCVYTCPDGTLKELNCASKCPKTLDGCPKTSETETWCNP